MTVVVDTPTIVPTFNAVPPICPNGTLAALPTTSTNNITGSWAPALDPTQTTTYTFTPDTAQCALPTTLTIIVNPESQVTVNSSAICPGSSTTVTATPAIAGSYSYAWSVPQGAADPGDVASFTTSTPGTYTVVITPISSFCNSDFETPVATGTTPNLVNDSAVPCWNTTSADGIIEIWPPGFEGVTPYSGNNLVELNANTPGTLYQDFSVIPGTSISVSFAHRGRQGVDVVGVEVGPVGGPYTSLGNFSDGNTAWALHTVNYTIPTGAGTNYTLRFVSVSSTGGNPSIGNLLDAISISSLGCASQPASGVVTVQNLPDPTVTVTQPTCTVPTGTIVVTSPLNGTGSGTPSNLFISEVTDAAAGSLTYVELYNGTGAAIDLANYKLKVYNYGSTPGNPVNLSCDLPLTGMIAANTTKVIKVSSSAEIPGITPDLVFAGCGGVNNNDYIKLTTSADVDVDLWGMTDGSSYTPGGAAGYTYRRLNTATLPSTTWNAADWTALDPEDYTNIGTYAMSAGTYEYSLDGGTYQPGTTFAGVAPGPHTITVHDLVTGCYSIAFSVTVDAVVGQVPSVTGFHYDTASVCILSSTNPVVVPDAGFTAGGTYTATPSGLTLDPTTGAVTTATSQVGTYTVTYSILFDPVTCQSAGSSTSTVEIVATTPAVVGISYSAASYCKIEVPNTVTPTMATGYTVGGTYSATPTGLSIDATTGVITLATSAPNTYVVSYTVASSAANCIAANTGTFTVTVTAPTLAGVGIIDYGTATTYCKIAVPNTVSPGMVTGYTVGGTYSATPSGLSIDATTGIVTLGTSTPNTYTITYSVNDIPGSCIAANSGTFTLTVTAPTLPVVGFDYTTPICSSDTTLTPSFATGFVSGGTFSSSILAVDAITGVVTITQGTPAGSYDVLYSVAQNTVTCELANTDTATIVVNAPISIGVIGDCQNNDFVLTVSPVTGTFDPAATYAWSNGSAPLGSTATQTVSAAGTYTVTVTLNGCVSTASIIVSKEDIACMIQKGISADGDGLNDNFDLTAFNVKKITIFNRYGMEVYSKTDYTNQWKGEDKNGDELPDGTYYYVFNRDNGETRTGWIYINRRN
jgi:gliding motility-associated-like protein